MKIDAIMIKEKDNVATALRNLKSNEKIIIGANNTTKDIVIRESILYGHKFAVKNILKGEYIFKYGEIIGRATDDIEPGTHAHVQNIESLRGRGDLERTEISNGI